MQQEQALLLIFDGAHGLETVFIRLVMEICLLSVQKIVHTWENTIFSCENVAFVDARPSSSNVVLDCFKLLLRICFLPGINVEQSSMSYRLCSWVCECGGALWKQPSLFDKQFGRFFNGPRRGTHIRQTVPNKHTHPLRILFQNPTIRWISAQHVNHGGSTFAGPSSLTPDRSFRNINAEGLDVGLLLQNNICLLFFVLTRYNGNWLHNVASETHETDAAYGPRTLGGTASGI